jgi:ketosteroid isomerase-like protein
MVVAASIALVCVASGCPIFKKGPSDQELLQDLLNTYETSLNEADVDALIKLYSEDYMGRDGNDYEQTVEFLGQIVPALEEYGVEVSAAEAEIEIDGKTATIGPVILDTPEGSMELTLLTTKEDDGCWRITGSEMEQ